MPGFCKVLVGLAFIAAGGGKLLHLSDTIGMFDKLRLPAWFAYLIGGAELLGGIGLLIPRFTQLAAAGLIIIMLGAAYMHTTRMPGGLLPNGLGTLGLLLGLVLILVLRRPQVLRN